MSKDDSFQFEMSRFNPIFRLRSDGLEYAESLSRPTHETLDDFILHQTQSVVDTGSRTVSLFGTLPMNRRRLTEARISRAKC